ncbi:MAG: hypothetical protein ACE5FM_07660 [Methyloligellaceae bacterium]
MDERHECGLRRSFSRHQLPLQTKTAMLTCGVSKEVAMASKIVLLFAAGVIAAMGASAVPADAKPKQTGGSCAIKGGRAPCSWVEACLLDGGTPERQAFTGKLLCKGVTKPATGILQNPAMPNTVSPQAPRR